MKEKIDIERILDELEDAKEYYDLNGVEMTEEDAQNVVSLLQQGMTMNDAILEVLNGIRSVLSQGWEY
jgi:lipoate-protein ligase A